MGELSSVMTINASSYGHRSLSSSRLSASGRVAFIVVWTMYSWYGTQWNEKTSLQDHDATENNNLTTWDGTELNTTYTFLHRLRLWSELQRNSPPKLVMESDHFCFSSECIFISKHLYNHQGFLPIQNQRREHRQNQRIYVKLCVHAHNMVSSWFSPPGN